METTAPALTQMNIYSISRRHGCREVWLPPVPPVGGPGGVGTVSGDPRGWTFRLQDPAFAVPAGRSPSSVTEDMEAQSHPASSSAGAA